MRDYIKLHRRWTIERYETRHQAEPPVTVTDAEGRELPGKSVFEGNTLLNEGINNVLLPTLGGTGSPTVYDNSNAYLGVGGDSSSEDATHTGLQDTGAVYKGMFDTSYPSVSSQTISWKAQFDTDEANQDWREFTVANVGSDSGDNLNRKVSDQGTKSSGQVWNLTLDITFS